MSLLKCLVVDDEPPAIRLLESYISKVPFLQCEGTTSKALEALSLINKGGIDLVFLDIQMPELTGIQISRIVKGETKIIFTTAYPQFALESYELNAVDYLLKPIEFERFYAAVLKMKGDESKFTIKGDDFLFVKIDGKNNFEKIYIKDICFVEGLKNYVVIHLSQRKIITYNTLKNIYEYLPHQQFIKVHKSYIVALNHIDRTDSVSVYVGEHSLPIGDTYRQAFFEVIRGKRL